MAILGSIYSEKEEGRGCLALMQEISTNKMCLTININAKTQYRDRAISIAIAITEIKSLFLLCERRDK